MSDIAVTYHITKGKGVLEIQIITPENLSQNLTNKLINNILTRFGHGSTFGGPRETRRFEATLSPPEHGQGWYIDLGIEDIDFNPATNVVKEVV